MVGTRVWGGGVVGMVGGEILMVEAGGGREWEDLGDGRAAWEEDVDGWRE